MRLSVRPSHDSTCSSRLLDRPVCNRRIIHEAQSEFYQVCSQEYPYNLAIRHEVKYYQLALFFSTSLHTSSNHHRLPHSPKFDVPNCRHGNFRAPITHKINSAKTNPVFIADHDPRHTNATIQQLCTLFPAPILL